MLNGTHRYFAQERVIYGKPAAETLAARVLEIEHRIYPDALRLLAGGKIRLDGDICRLEGDDGSGNVLISPAVDPNSA